jgi:hypothetical protein
MWSTVVFSLSVALRADPGKVNGKGPGETILPLNQLERNVSHPYMLICLHAYIPSIPATGRPCP